MLVRHFVRSAPPPTRRVAAHASPDPGNVLAALAAVRLVGRQISSFERGIGDWAREEGIPRRRRDEVRALVDGWSRSGRTRVGDGGICVREADDPDAEAAAEAWRLLVDRASLMLSPTRRLLPSFERRFAAARAVAAVCDAFSTTEGSDDRGTWTSFAVHCGDVERVGEDRREWLLSTPEGWVGTTWRRINFLGDLDEWLVLGRRDHPLEQMREILAVPGGLRSRLEAHAGRRFPPGAVEAALPLVAEAAAPLAAATSRTAARLRPDAVRTVRDFHAFGYRTTDGEACFPPTREGVLGANDAPLRLAGEARPGNMLQWQSLLDGERSVRFAQAAALFPNCVPDLVAEIDAVAAGASVPGLLAGRLLGSDDPSPEDVRTVARIARRMVDYRDVLAEEAAALAEPLLSRSRRRDAFHPLAVLVRAAGTDRVLDQADDEGRRAVLLLARTLVPLVLPDGKGGLPDGMPGSFGRALARDPLRAAALVREGVFDMVRALADAMSDAFGLAGLPQPRRDRVRTALLSQLVGRDGGLKAIAESNRVWHRDNAALDAQIRLLRTSVARAEPPTGEPGHAVSGGRIAWLLDGPALSAEGEAMSHCIRFSLRDVVRSGCFVASVLASDGTRSTAKFRRGDVLHREMVPGSDSAEMLPVVAEHRARSNADPSQACRAVVDGFLSAVYAGRISWTPARPIPESEGSGFDRDGEPISVWHPGTRPEDVLAVWTGVLGPRLSDRTVDDWWEVATAGAIRG